MRFENCDYKWNYALSLLLLLFAGHTRAEGTQSVRRHTSDRHHTDNLARGRLHELLHQSDTVRISIRQFPQGIPQGELGRVSTYV